MRTILIALCVGLLLGALVGLAAGYWLWHHEPQVTTETFQPGKVQADGSVKLTRVPTAPADAGPPPHLLPPKAKETGRIHVKVQPKSQPAEEGKPACTCDPFTIDLSLFKDPSGTGVIGSSDDAEIDVASSTYTPMQTVDPPQYRSFAMVTNEPGSDSYSGLFGRRFLGNRLGVAIGAAKQEGQPVRALVGIEVNW